MMPGDEFFAVEVEAMLQNLYEAKLFHSVPLVSIQSIIIMLALVPLLDNQKQLIVD